MVTFLVLFQCCAVSLKTFCLFCDQHWVETQLAADLKKQKTKKASPSKCVAIPDVTTLIRIILKAFTKSP